MRGLRYAGFLVIVLFLLGCIQQTQQLTDEQKISRYNYYIALLQNGEKQYEEFKVEWNARAQSNTLSNAYVAGVAQAALEYYKTEKRYITDFESFLDKYEFDLQEQGINTTEGRNLILIHKQHIEKQKGFLTEEVKERLEQKELEKQTREMLEALLRAYIASG